MALWLISLGGFAIPATMGSRFRRTWQRFETQEQAGVPISSRGEGKPGHPEPRGSSEPSAPVGSPSPFHPPPRIGLTIFTPAKSRSLSVTTTQSFASAMAATIISSGLRGRPCAAPSAIRRAQTLAASSLDRSCCARDCARSKTRRDESRRGRPGGLRHGAVSGFRGFLFLWSWRPGRALPCRRR